MGDSFFSPEDLDICFGFCTNSMGGGIPELRVCVRRWDTEILWTACTACCLAAGAW